MLKRVWKCWTPPPNLKIREWADRFRRLAKGFSAEPGRYNSMRTPWVRGIQDAIDDPNVEKVVMMKASQTAFTDGVIVNYLLKLIDIDPCAIIIMFPRTQAAEDFMEEKFAPAVRATPRMKGRIDVETSRKAGNKKLFKRFAGGMLKLVGSNSPGNVKSVTVRVVIIEEPDDANTNVKGQGDTIKLVEDRNKTHDEKKTVYGGTPTIKGLSAIEDGYNASDKRMYFVPCHDCGESHVLDWANVKWDENADIEHEIYGRAILGSAYYACPHCGSVWNDEQKNKNVQAAESTDGAGWIATAPFHGIAGFGFVSELYAPFSGSRFSVLLRRYLEAQHKKDQGDDTDWIAFVNTCLGKPYEYENKNKNSKSLKGRAEDYQELIVPEGGLLITWGIDVQHDRVALIGTAWGRGEESWRIYWGEISAENAVTDTKDPVWTELEQMVFTPKDHERGFKVPTSAVSIDSSDGQTNDAVYHWVRAMSKKYPTVKVMAIKGASDNTDKEIFAAPLRSIDHKTPTKASKYGLRVFIVGTNKAKDLFTARIQLEGGGPGRVHYYESIRADYFDQITSEVKAPSRRYRGKKVWQKKAGVRNEGFDCEVYNLHASRAVKVHLKTPAQWDALEQQLQQADLFSQPAASTVVSQETKIADTGSDPYGNVNMMDSMGGDDGWL
jgi:phage terminase large subunit GpA-like protein